MMKSLVGYTGFVGSNLAASEKFDGLYNSKNISDAFGTKPDILYFAAVPAQKFIADKYPQKDLETITTAIENIKKINPKKLVLISTVDVYKETDGKTEDSTMETGGLAAYGANRFYFESEIRRLYPDNLTVRLPGLYGKNLKKNFIYDFINYIPALLTDKKITELAEKSGSIYDYYINRQDGFWSFKEGSDRQKAKDLFKKLGFSALNFTDSRGQFQYYNLHFLYKDIQIAINNNIKLLNIATEPVEIGYLHKVLTGEDFVNCISDNPPKYNFKTKYDRLFGGRDGYIQTKEFVYNDIKKFVGEKI